VDRPRAPRSVNASVYLIWPCQFALPRSKVNGCVPQTQLGNLRRVGQAEGGRARCSHAGSARGCARNGHPGGNPGANLKSISHRCHPILVAFVWELTKETIYLPLGCLRGGLRGAGAGKLVCRGAGGRETWRSITTAWRHSPSSPGPPSAPEPGGATGTIR